MYAIETNNLTKKYKNKTVVDKVNLFVPEGSIFGFVGENGAYEAEVHKGCTLTPQSMGGDAYVDMPIDINFSNDKIHGTVNDYKYGSTITFTKASS